ncbi:MAG: HNH endonuclease [Acidimicrobiia bacterium]
MVLNATYEPLCVVPARRAVVLVLSDKAEVVHPTDQVMHSARLQVNVPSVVRLVSYVRVPVRRRAPLNRRAVFARDGHRCQYCGGDAESIDHVVPRSRGGEHAWDNVVAACRPCNSRKRDRLLAETTMALRRHPRVPRELTWVTVAVGSVPSAWEPYLGPPARVPARVPAGTSAAGTSAAGTSAAGTSPVAGPVAPLASATTSA